jgi:hypothetical protein
MTRKDVEELFKNEKYDKATIMLKKELKDDPENGELLYYLFLAENRDYSNIDLNNIVNEVNFNRALEYSNRRLKNEFEAEYNFYRDCDPEFRRMFCYASRENKEQVLKLYEKVKTAKLPSNLTEYIDNMDYVVTSKITKEALELNILTTNLLYICTKEEKIKPVLKQLVSIMSQIDKRYVEYILFENKRGLKKYVIDKSPDSNDDDIELIEIPKDEEKQKEETNKTSRRKNIIDEDKNDDKNGSNNDPYRGLLIAGIICLVFWWPIGIILLIVYATRKK